MSEETVEVSNDLELEKFVAYGQLFAQLLESARFRDFMETFYTIQKFVDDQERVVTFQIIENPPDIIAKKIAEATKNAAPGIELVSGDTAQKILEQAKKGARRR